MAEREKKTKKLQGVVHTCTYCGATEWRVSRSGNWVCTQCNQPQENSGGEEEAPPKVKGLARKSAAKKPEPRAVEGDYSDSYYTTEESQDPAPSPNELRHRSPETEEEREARSRRNRPAAPAANGPVDTSRTSSGRRAEAVRELQHRFAQIEADAAAALKLQKKEFEKTWGEVDETDLPPSQYGRYSAASTAAAPEATRPVAETAAKPRRKKGPAPAAEPERRKPRSDKPRLTPAPEGRPGPRSERGRSAQRRPRSPSRSPRREEAPPRRPKPGKGKAKGKKGKDEGYWMWSEEWGVHIWVAVKGQLKKGGKGKGSKGKAREKGKNKDTPA